MHKVYAYSAKKNPKHTAICVVSRDALALCRVKMVKDIIDAKKTNILQFFCTVLLFALNNLPPYTVIRHYTIITFDRFATLYCYLAYTFIWHSRVYYDCKILWFRAVLVIGIATKSCISHVFISFQYGAFTE